MSSSEVPAASSSPVVGLGRRSTVGSTQPPVSEYLRRPFVRLFLVAFACAILVLGAYRADSLAQRNLLDSVRNDRFLPEALIAGRPASRSEARELYAILEEYGSSAPGEGTSAIEGYLSRSPGSPWRVSLLTNLGMIHYRSGHFSKAIAAFDLAWKEGKKNQGPEQRAIAEHAFGELVRMHARLGHVSEVEALLADIDGRKLLGGASEAVAGAREGLWVMKNEPGIAYLCGPMALKAILELGEPDQEAMAAVRAIRSGEKGVTLAELGRHAAALRMPLATVFRESVLTPIPVPSVVHWKLNHYAAIVEESGGMYRVKDPTFGRDLWLTSEAVNAESSGYFMLPGDRVREGWRLVGTKEASSILGAGYTNSLDPDATRPSDPKECGGGCPAAGAPEKGMARYAVHSTLVSLNIRDIPLGYSPPKGPKIEFHLTYNQREANQPANFNFSNVGQKWTHDWLSYVTDSPSQPGVDVSLAMLGGGTERYGGYDAATGSFTPESSEGARLVRLVGPNQVIYYERRLPDGAVHVYRAADGATAYPRRIFLTEMRDPADNAVTLEYNAQLRLTGVVDALGQRTTVHYEGIRNPFRITRVTDPFGRSARLVYDSMGRLESIRDVIGMVSAFGYDDGTFINSMTTPYGTTSFAYDDLSGTSRWIEITDPMGYKERVETRHSAPGIPYSESIVPTGIGVFNSYIDGRNTFYWDKDALAVAGGDYTKAIIRHWLHDGVSTTVTAPVLESTKTPLENRVWFNYEGQAHNAYTGAKDKPTVTARVLPDGQTQLSKAEYNDIGRVTKSVDPTGRELVYEYASNGIDLLRIKRRNGDDHDLLAAYGDYNALHQPQTHTDAAGRVTRYRYNSAGQVTRITDPLLNSREFEYDANGYLTLVRNENGAVESTYAYDGFGRVTSITDSEGHQRQFEYDVLDRLTKVVYPDATFEQYGYDKLDRVGVRDRLGRLTSYAYNANRQLTRVDEPLPRTILYEWTPAGRLSKLTDGEGNVTRWEYDVQGRKTAEIYEDDSRIAYSYDSAGRLSTIQDAMNQVKAFTYTADDLVAGIGYANAVHATAAVGFAYDPVYPRRTAMHDGMGDTLYTYKPVGTLGALQSAQEDGPYSNDIIAYGYDALGRETSRSVNGEQQTLAFDSIGRMVTRTNALGAFEYGYLGQTNQIQSRNSAQGPVLFNSYDTNLHDRVLRAIEYLQEEGGIGTGRSAPGTQADVLVPVQEYRYQRNTIGHVTRIEEIPGGEEVLASRWDLGYDNIDRLWSYAPVALEPFYSYEYDRADNRPSANFNGTMQSASFNPLNQLTVLDGRTHQYDLNGNLLDDGANEYQWDAENRLIAVLSKTVAGRRSDFSYDGYGRRLLIRDTPAAGQAVVERRYTWCGEKPCQERDFHDAVLTLYFEEGELQQGDRMFYLQDQLGSVRQLQNITAATSGGYDYGPYGEAVDGYGTATSRYRYAGMFLHEATGLYLTWYRPYQSETGRWLSRDPIGITGGINLYAYVGLNPAGYVDSIGLNATLIMPRPLPAPLPGVMPRPVPAPIDPALPLPMPYPADSLPRTGDCKDSEWLQCQHYCFPQNAAGCYVSINWRARGLRGGNLIKSEERRVNCRCDGDDQVACR